MYLYITQSYTKPIRNCILNQHQAFCSHPELLTARQACKAGWRLAAYLQHAMPVQATDATQSALKAAKQMLRTAWPVCVAAGQDLTPDQVQALTTYCVHTQKNACHCMEPDQAAPTRGQGRPP